ncbi:hypothetical protein SKPI104516_04820 [Skermania piniformis]
MQNVENIFSQHGEDGVVDSILTSLPERDGWAVEFGAWDGVFLSNTAALVEQGYRRVLIEGGESRYRDLKARLAVEPKAIPIHAMVGWEGDQKLDRILARTDVPLDFDVLSIDIDGNDYHVWKAVEKYRPKLVVIEFNPTIRDGIDFVQPADPAVRRGSSLTALVELAATKRYSLAATTLCNAFFVTDELLPHLDIADNSIEALHPHSPAVSDVFFGFDGTAVFTGSAGLLWHGLEQPEEIRLLPRLFVGFPGDFGRVRSVLFGLYRLLRVRKGRRGRSGPSSGPTERTAVGTGVADRQTSGTAD